MKEFLGKNAPTAAASRGERAAVTPPAPPAASAAAASAASAIDDEEQFLEDAILAAVLAQSRQEFESALDTVTAEKSAGGHGSDAAAALP